MTLGDFMTLRIIRSPFLVGGDPTPADVRAFLWLLNPGYDPRRKFRRMLFMRRCRVFLPPEEPKFWSASGPYAHILRAALADEVDRWATQTVKALETFGQVLKEIREYIEDTLQDWGSTKSEAKGNSISYFTDGVAIIGMIAREYGWSEKEILALPMKGALQYIKEIRQAHGEKVLFNKSDRILFEFARQENSRC